MTIRATQKYTRQTPRKVRLVANAVRKLTLEEAFRQLSVIERKATEVVSKVMKQAVADAVNNHGYQVSDLVLDSIIVNEGPRYKRFNAVSRGRAHNIIKRTCHVSVVLKTKDEAAAVKKPKVALEAAKIEEKVAAAPVKTAVAVKKSKIEKVKSKE